jgi:2-dehydropantoate 2-reductase
MSAVTVVGAGGIGGITAAALRAAGADVAIVDNNAEHVEAIRANGLRVTGSRGEQLARFDSVLLPEQWRAPADVVLLAVKSQHTAAAMRTVGPRLRDDGVVVSLQNGWNARTIAGLVGERRTLVTMLHVVGNHEGPGHVSRHSEGTVYIGPGERVTEVARLLAPAFPIEMVRNIWGYVWSKQVYGATMPVNALVDQPARETYAHDWVRSILVALMAEAAEVAAAEHITLERYERFDPAALAASVPRGSAKGNSGIWHDIKVRRRRTEVDHLSGELVRIGRRHRLPMHLNGRVVAMIADLETGRRDMSWDNLVALAEPARDFLRRRPALAACLPSLEEIEERP